MAKGYSVGAMAAVWLLLGAVITTAYADPVTLPITSGFLRYPKLNEASLLIQFPNGSAGIEWSDEQGDWFPDYLDTFPVTCCVPGTSLNLSTDESFPDERGRHFGEVRFGVETYSVTSFNFSVIALRDIIVPTLESGEISRFVDIPFTFRGTLFGTASDERTLVLNLNGFGGASGLFEGIDPTFATLEFPTYNFEAITPSPVPEPGTWLLVATGLGAMMRRVGKHRE